MKLRTCLALLRLHENLLLEELLQDPVLRTAWEIEMDLETDDDEDIESLMTGSETAEVFVAESEEGVYD